MSNRQIKFNLPKPDRGIIECFLTIEAADESEAVTKLVHYLIDLKREFSHQPLPVNEKDLPSKASKELVRRLSLITDPVTYVVTLHLFVEHWLNEILRRFCPKHDLTRYQFFKKLEIVYSMDKIPENLFLNLRKLNKLRNNIAHDINFDLTKMELDYLDGPKGFEMTQFKPSYEATAKHNHIFNVLNGVMFLTYFPLHNHCTKILGLDVAVKQTVSTETD